jgi:glutamate--cysteine ligase
VLERQGLREEVPRLALETPFRDTTVWQLALDVLHISRSGLRRRARINARGQDEMIYLDPLFQLVHDRKTVADELLERFHGRWNGSVDPVFVELAF